MPTVDVTATGQNIRAMMDRHGITVKDIQRTCGFASGNPVYKWINGACMPTIDNMVIIADMMHTTIDQIIVVRRA